MKHYIVIMRKTVMGMEQFVTQDYILDSDDINQVQDIPTEYKDELKTWTTADEGLLKAGARRLNGGLKTNEKPVGWDYTIEEFILNNCGMLTAFLYSEDGLLFKKYEWILNR